MKILTWAYLLGIMMMLFGGCNIASNLKDIYVYKFIEMGKEMVEDVPSLSSDASNSSSDAGKSTTKANTDQFGKHLDKFLFESKYAIEWTFRLGCIGLLFSIFYIIGGVFLLIRKSISPKLALTALGLSILFTIARSIILSVGPSITIWGIFSGFSNTFSMMIDLVFIIVILVSDKSAYKNETFHSTLTH